MRVGPNIVHNAQPTGSISGWGDLRLLGIGTLLTAALTATVVVLGTRASALLAIAAVSLIVILSLCLVDLASLPAIGLVLFALFPVQYLPVPTHDGAFSPALLAAVILVVRALAQGRRIAGGPHLAPVIVLGVWVVAATLLSPFVTTSALWTVNFLFLVVAPVLLLPGWREARQRLENCWLGLGGVLGAYAAIELALHHNLLMERLYTSGATHLVQGWGVYRITTTLGHPLTNGTFFAVAAMLGLGRAFAGERGWGLAATVLSCVGLAGSASRGPTIALGVGLVLLVLAMALRAGPVVNLRRLVLPVAVICALAGGAYVYLAARSSGSEAAGSLITRDETYQGGIALIRAHGLWGGGPGLADELKRNLPTGQAARGVESSALQLIISLGVPGILAATWLMLTAGLSSLRRRPELSACLVTYTVAAATYNLLETNRPALLLWGVLIGLSVRPDPWTPLRPAQSARA